MNSNTSVAYALKPGPELTVVSHGMGQLYPVGYL